MLGILRHLVPAPGLRSNSIHATPASSGLSTWIAASAAKQIAEAIPRNFPSTAQKPESAERRMLENMSRPTAPNEHQQTRRPPTDQRREFPMLSRRITGISRESVPFVLAAP